MAAKKNLPKRLFKTQDRISSYQPGRSAGKLMKQMSREHLDVLQNIEFVFAIRFREKRDIDDRAVSAAIRAYPKRSVPDDPLVAELVNDLDGIRRTRTDISDDLWNDALRVVDDSVRRHSRLSPGETGYLSFIVQYVR